ncbi:hypothetical protein T4B_3721, partial [Trichinella pseudospiralis]
MNINDERRRRIWHKNKAECTKNRFRTLHNANIDRHKVRTRTTRSRSQCARSTIKQDQRYMRRFPVGPNSVSQGKGYLEKVKLSHSPNVNDKPTLLSFNLMQYLVLHAAKL